MFEAISFLKREFNTEWPREQNIKCRPWSMNVARRYRQNNSNNYAHARTLSALSGGGGGGGLCNPSSM